MRIVITRRGNLDVPDGINIFIFSLAHELLTRGVEVFAVSSSASSMEKIRENYRFDAYPEIVALSQDRRPAPRYADLLRTWYLHGRSFIKKTSPDLVIVNGALPFSLGAGSAVVSHDLEMRLIGRTASLLSLYKRIAYSKADHIVATCTEIRDALSSQIRIEKEQIHTIPTCINYTDYTSRPIANRKNALLHIGTPTYKNPVSSIRALQYVTDRSTELYITGNPSEEVHRALNELDSDVQSRIHLVGYVSAERLRQLLASVKAVTVPSVYEVPVASPTVLEAFASGTPVVASPSISEDLLSNGVNGFVRDPSNPRSIADAVNKLISDDDIWINASLAARRRAESFSAAKVADAYLGLDSQKR